MNRLSSLLRSFLTNFHNFTIITYYILSTVISFLVIFLSIFTSGIIMSVGLIYVTYKLVVLHHIQHFLISVWTCFPSHTSTTSFFISETFLDFFYLWFWSSKNVLYRKSNKLISLSLFNFLKIMQMDTFTSGIFLRPEVVNFDAIDDFTP